MSLQGFLLEKEQDPLIKYNILSELHNPIDGELGVKTLTALEYWIDLQLTTTKPEYETEMLRAYNNDYYKRTTLLEKRAVVNNMLDTLHKIGSSLDWISASFLDHKPSNLPMLTNRIKIYNTYLKQEEGVIWNFLKDILKTEMEEGIFWEEVESSIYDELSTKYTYVQREFQKKIQE